MDPKNYRLPSLQLSFVGEIDEQNTSAFLKDLWNCQTHYGQTQEPRDLLVRLSSDGGDEGLGWAIYDAFQTMRENVIIIGYGLVGSMAAAVLQGAGPGGRWLTPRARLMIHNGSSNYEDTVHSSVVISMGKEQVALNKVYHEVLAQRSKMTVKKVARLCEKETFLSAREAVKLGLADAIYGVE